jgi:hypothetical protein
VTVPNETHKSEPTTPTINEKALAFLEKHIL